VSFGWGPNVHESRRHVQDLAVQRILENGESVLVVAMQIPGVTAAEVERWVKEAQEDDSAVSA
jgi:hypothetical protein